MSNDYRNTNVRKEKIMNKVTLIGRTTKEIELKKTNSNKSYCQFTLAVNRDKENSDFINCVAWNKLAELLSQYVSKGNRIGVNGRIATRTYEGRDRKVYVTEVVADEVEFLENKKEQSTSNSTTYRKDINVNDQFDSDFNASEFVIDDDDLPF